jgi:protein-arginine kinase activator protein McsA
MDALGSTFTTIGILGFILSVLMIITFFVMASRLKKIENILDVLMQLELKKPENKKQIRCEKCGKEYSVSTMKRGYFNCAECKAPIKL